MPWVSLWRSIKAACGEVDVSDVCIDFIQNSIAAVPVWSEVAPRALESDERVAAGCGTLSHKDASAITVALAKQMNLFGEVREMHRLRRALLVCPIHDLDRDRP